MSRYLTLLWEFSVNSLRAKHYSSWISFVLSLVNPFIFTTVLFFLFRSRFHALDGKAGFFYIMIGTMVWNYLGQGISGGLTSLRSRADVVRNLVFPVEILVLSQVLTRLFHHLFEMLVVISLLHFFGYPISPSLFLLPVVIIFITLFITGVSLILACLYVYLHDTTYLYSFSMSLLFFATPIFYRPYQLSQWAQKIITYNPLMHFISFYRLILLDHQLPALSVLSIMGILSCGIFIIGLGFFNWQKHRIVEVI